MKGAQWLAHLTRRVEKLEEKEAAREAVADQIEAEENRSQRFQYWIVPLLITAVNAAVSLATFFLNHR